MKNIHLLPTDKPSRLTLSKKGLFLQKHIYQNKISKSFGLKNQHIYITNSEEIKEGDWYFFNYQIIKCENPDLTKIPIVTKNYCKKIILTTDQDLIKDGVQAIDDEFLEWFVKNPSCEEVEVGYGWIRLTETNNEGYWVSIPNEQIEMQQEEPNRTHYLDELPNIDKDVLLKMYNAAVPKLNTNQETLEEAAEKYSEENGNAYSMGIDDAFEAGAKWQQERMYSEEEVYELLLKHQSAYRSAVRITSPLNWSFDIKQWFEQFKKK